MRRKRWRRDDDDDDEYDDDDDNDDNEDGSHILHLVDFLSASIELPPDGSSLLVSQVELVKKTMSIVVK